MSTDQSFQTISIVIPIAIVTAAVVLMLLLRRRRSRLVVDREQVVRAQADWRAPDGLSDASLPRAVAYTGTAMAVAVVALLAVGGGGVLSWILAQKVSRDQQETALLQREGVAVDGSVTRKWTTTGRSHTQYIAYRYSAPDGPHNATASVANALYRRVEAGAEVKVTYAASNPAVSRVEQRIGSPPWVPYIVLLPMIIVLFILPFAVLQQRKLLAYGSPAAAVIEQVSPMKGGYLITYQFIGADGEAVKGRSSVSSGGKPAAGETITIIYDPDRPKRSARYPLKYVKLAR